MLNNRQINKLNMKLICESNNVMLISQHPAISISSYNFVISIFGSSVNDLHAHQRFSLYRLPVVAKEIAKFNISSITWKVIVLP